MQISIYSQIYIEAAQQLGYDYEILGFGLVQYTAANKTWRTFYSRLPINNAVSMRIAEKKADTLSILRNNDIPVPSQSIVTTLEDALDVYQSKKYENIVIKPNIGMSGNGITIKPDSRDKFINGVNNALEESEEVIIEEYIQGQDYRLLVLDHKVIAASLREPASIVGDGEHTIQQLIDSENITRRKSKRLEQIDIDDNVINTLEERNICLEDIPDDGQKILLRKNSNLNTGGKTIDVTDLVHPNISEIAVKAAQLIGLKVAGVDIITDDISNPTISGGINEINSNPGLRIHLYPSEGISRKVNVEILKYVSEHIIDKKFNE